MRRLGYFLMCFITAALLTSGAVHAQEFPNAPTLECSGFVHADGDADQSQGDADRSVPHHHGSCHGAASLIPARITTPVLFDRAAEPEGFVNSEAPGRWSPGPDLRPPIA